MMKRRSFVFWGALITLLLWQEPYLSAEKYPRGDSSAVLPTDSLSNMIFTAASRQGVDPALVEAVIAVESAFNPLAISPKGAMGLMQLMPATASRYGVSNPLDPRENLTGGIQYLRDLLLRFEDFPHALAAYNAGETAVLTHGGVPPYRETQQYVQKVLAWFRPGQAPPSSSSVLSIGRWSSEVGRVMEKAKDYFRLAGVSQMDASPTSAAINSGSPTTSRTAEARRPLTKVFRGPLVRMRKAPRISVKLRVQRYRRSS